MSALLPADFSPTEASNRPASAQPPQIGATTGMLLVAANMIGTGIFMSGEVLKEIGSGPAVLLAWVAGGVAAFCGALAYAELGAALPHNGGEYQFLSRALHPSIGFMSGFVSIFVGFCAPLAIAAYTFGSYLSSLFDSIRGAPHVDPLFSGLLLLGACAAVHIVHVEFGHWFQNVSTAVKVGLIVVFILAGLGFCHWSYLTAGAKISTLRAVALPQFAVGLVTVTYAYSGWNAAAYVAGEFRNPQRNIPLALLGGTGLVAILYLALTAVFLASAPMETLQVEKIGHAAAIGLFGPRGGNFMTALIVLGMIPTVGSYLVTGSRVSEAIGKQIPVLHWLAWRHARGGAVVAILVQTCVAAGLMISARLIPNKEPPAVTLMIFTGLTLTFFSTLAVVSLFVLRFREPNLPRPYRTWGYPLTPIVFLLLQGWMLSSGIAGNRLATIASLFTLLLSFVVWRVATWIRPGAT